MAVINTNYLALVSQNNLNKSQNSLGQAIERLSSGLRINSAKDDAAGQAIANRFTANIKGLTQAARNANDGISLAQTTEGALNEINDNIQRIRELTVDAANGTKSESDLKSIQDEISQRKSEITRITEQTQFNGIKVLGADAKTLSIQVGANDGETIAIDLSKMDVKDLGIDKLDVTKAYSAKSYVNVENGQDITMKFDAGNVTNSLEDASNNANDGKVGDQLYYDSTAEKYYVEVTGRADDTQDGFYEVTADATGALSIAQTAVGPANATEKVDGITVTASGINALDVSGAAAVPGGQVTDVLTDGNGKVFVKVDSADNPDHNGYYEAGIDWTSGEVNVTSVAAANVMEELPDNAASLVGANAKPLESLDEALSLIDNLRSSLGAIQNRFESTINNLNTTIANLSSSKSRIEDADYAVEVSSMTRSQILQQAGTSVLAQANQIPQNMLSLLG